MIEFIHRSTSTYQNTMNLPPGLLSPFTMNYPSFVSPFSRPGFGILNDNASFAQEGTLQYEAEQSIYLNKHQYQQPHAHNPEGFFNASITDSSPYGPTDQSVYVKDVTHPGSDTRNEALFRLPASPEPTQMVMQDGDRGSQLSATQSSHTRSQYPV
ncbi:hypothetical protein O181_016096 [Austropuccinia psidii MF-1]|uniref:Uncharacterized protein n=1 Tax=Austropuccinia psidii MF-1 TaxID=1389203 RepID=A0A9Q3GQQ3_9BASI|nr:hypothetical protein [Austropuccinia psidii MF-1]